ncbi:MAG: MbnP family copper-binding protein [Myxococcota bacterium]
MMNRNTCLALLPVVVLACGDDDEPVAVTLEFDAVIGAVSAGCDTMITDVDANGTDAMLADARLFISEIELQNGDGDWTPLALEQSSVWQTANVALLDFENGAGSCSSSGTAEMNNQVIGELPSGEYSGLRFTVGLPFDLNHLDDATSPAPLNSPGMFWQWQDGYKFVRVDWMPNNAERWNVHLGSRGCDNGGDLNTVPPDSECTRSNRPRIELAGYTLLDPVIIDLGELVASSNVSTNLPMSPPGCMSAPTETEDCDPVFGALGLDFASGDCVAGCEGQSVFSR